MNSVYKKITLIINSRIKEKQWFHNSGYPSEKWMSPRNWKSLYERFNIQRFCQLFEVLLMVSTKSLFKFFAHNYQVDKDCVCIWYIYIGEFFLSICFLLSKFQSMFSIIQVSKYVFYNPSFKVCFLLSRFQSMFSIIQVSKYVYYYPSFRVCFLLSKFQSMFSIIQVSKYVFYYPSFKVCLLLSKFQSMFSIIHVS